MGKNKVKEGAKIARENHTDFILAVDINIISELKRIFLYLLVLQKKFGKQIEKT